MEIHFYLNLKEIQFHTQQITSLTNERDIANNENFLKQATNFYEANFKEVENLRTQFNEMKNQVIRYTFKVGFFSCLLNFFYSVFSNS